jgi:thioredoxin 1
LAAETGKVEFVKLNIDDNPATASRYDVLSIPTVILFDRGEPRETLIGARPPAHFRKAFAPYL